MKQVPSTFAQLTPNFLDTFSCPNNCLMPKFNLICLVNILEKFFNVPVSFMASKDLVPFDEDYVIPSESDAEIVGEHSRNSKFSYVSPRSIYGETSNEGKESASTYPWPMQPSGDGGPTWWTPGTLPVVPVRYR